MKKLLTKALTFAMGSIIAFSAIWPANIVFAATSDWTESYAYLLSGMVDDIKNEREFYTKFALHDIEGDGNPELFLLNTSVNGGYRIYRNDNSNTVLEKTIYSNGFYVSEDGKFVISYGDSTGNNYVYYDSGVSLANSEKLFRYRNDVQDSKGNWSYIYYYKNKEVSKEDYDKLFDRQLNQISFAFSDINSENIDLEVYQGLGFPKDGSAAYFYITKPSFSSGGQVHFSDTSMVDADDIFGLLMVNGKIINNAFPINIDSRTLVPVRAVGESLDAKVEWVGGLQKIIITGKSKIEMYVDNHTATVNGERVSLDVAPQIVDGTTYVPIRFVSENLGADVYFVPGEKNFLPIISIESAENKDFRGLDDGDAEYKVKQLFKDVRWLHTNTVFVRNYMDERVSIKVEELVANRFWSIKLDEKGTQKIWVDRFSGQVFSRFDVKNTCGLQPGTDAAISALVETYAY